MARRAASGAKERRRAVLGARPEASEAVRGESRSEKGEPLGNDGDARCGQWQRLAWR